MDFVNGTAMSAAFTMGLDSGGRESVVVVIKGTFLIPAQGGAAPLADTQDPLVFADTFTGKPGFSAVVYECDFAPFKPRCDVLLLGSAHAPPGRQVTNINVGLRVGTMTKGFEVVGDRHWTAGALGVSASQPKPFTSMPITYDRAFGGLGEVSADNPALTNAYAPNPVGVGYFPQRRDRDLFARPLPNTHETNEPVSSPNTSYRPMAFGPIGRNFASRVAFAGTYDERWVAEVFPFLPSDFRDDYYQAAPSDQQILYPRGGEIVQIVNLTPQEQPPFHLPRVDMPVEFNNKEREQIRTSAVIDTVLLEPDRGRMNLVWRASLPLRDSIREITQVVIGHMSPGWYRARRRGKRYFPSLRALAAARLGG